MTTICDVLRNPDRHIFVRVSEQRIGFRASLFFTHSLCLCCCISVHDCQGNYKGVETKWRPEMGTWYDQSATDIDGQVTKFETFDNTVVLAVNVASK